MGGGVGAGGSSVEARLGSVEFWLLLVDCVESCDNRESLSGARGISTDPEKSCEAEMKGTSTRAVAKKKRMPSIR